MTPLSPTAHRARRLSRTIVVLAVGLVLALSLGASSVAAQSLQKTKNTPCGKKVLNDWWDNGRVDRLYPPHCYEEAIDAIPTDIRDYSDAEEVINRALLAAVRGKIARGGPDPSAEGDDEIREPSTPVKPGDSGGGSGDPEATPDVDAGTSSVPIPLLVLGGMSLALLAAGGLGYLSRRRQAAAVDADGQPLDPLL